MSERFTLPVEIMGRPHWQCVRCGSLVPEDKLKVHEGFHVEMDRILNALIATLNKFSGGSK